MQNARTQKDKDEAEKNLKAVRRMIRDLEKYGYIRMRSPSSNTYNDAQKQQSSPDNHKMPPIFPASLAAGKEYKEEKPGQKPGKAKNMLGVGSENGP